MATGIRSADGHPELFGASLDTDLRTIALSLAPIEQAA
jgi:hypothetical protein